jgi:hypothetical protein
MALPITTGGNRLPFPQPVVLRPEDVSLHLRVVVRDDKELHGPRVFCLKLPVATRSEQAEGLVQKGVNQILSPCLAPTNPDQDQVLTVEKII